MILMATILFSYCCRNNHHKLSDLEIIQTYYSLTVLEVRSQGVRRAALCPGASRKHPFPCVSQLLEAACAAWLTVPPSTVKAPYSNLLPSSCLLL